MTGPPPQTKYSDLAAAIASGRAMRHLTQAELATELGIKQQSVSRWEAGTHRPTVSQIPALAAIIRREPHDLMTLAGFGMPVAASHTTMFPVEALEPATFEHFVADLVEALHPEAEVQVQGGRGHEQAGTDILARFPDKTVWSFQCKRVGRFGKADVDKVVKHHTAKASRKFLVLSKIASPSAAESVSVLDGWTLWDKQYLTHLVRRLPGATQDRLVDIYFRGQRMALLGRREPGPWVDADWYFAPFQGRSAVFSHDWELVGRQAEIDRLLAALGSLEGPPVTLLIGAGGIGKTRILKEATQRFTEMNPATAVHFLSASREPDESSLEALGTGAKLLVVDDAHDREGLGLVIEFAADSRNRAGLLIVSRPYAEQRIRNELGLASIVDPATIRVEPLGKEPLTALILEVLKQFDGDPSWAGSILDVASDNPLVAAMAARVVATERLVSELAKGQTALRQVILSRFTKVITGNLGTQADAPLLRAVLEVLALIQPFHIDDRRIAQLVAAVRKGIDATDVSRALKLLTDGGVIYRRGHLFRLMPDLLGDFLIEESCVGADGKLTPFAVATAESVDSRQLTQVLVNLGRMDWRLAEGDPSASALLEPLWQQLNAISEKYDPRIEAVESVAYYQPAQALAFIHAQIDAGRILHEFGTILRRVALTPEYRLEALRLLWDLGREENRELNPYPGHPIRVLAELIEYEPHKPLAFIEEIADFAFALIDDPQSWAGSFTPLDVLQPLLSGQGVRTQSTGRMISMSSFFVDYKAVAHFRQRLIDRTLDLLSNDDPAVARKAALFLENALRSPYGMMGAAPSPELRALYEAEFKKTVDKLGRLVRTRRLAPTTIIGIIRSLSWHAQYGHGELQLAVQALFRELSIDLEFRLYGALADGAEWNFIGQVPYEDWREESGWATDLTAELLDRYDDARLGDLLSDYIETLRTAGESVGNSGFLIDRIISTRLEFAREIISRSVANPDARLRDYLGYATGAILDKEPAEGRHLIAELLRSSSTKLRSDGARGLIGLKRPHEEEDLVLLREVIAAADIAAIGIMALRTWRDVADREIIALALMVPFDEEPGLFEHFSMLICSRHSQLLDRMADRDVERLLQRMKRLRRLEGHLTGEILQHLALHHSASLALFLMERAEAAFARDTNADFRALGISHRRGHLGFHESPEARQILSEIWRWLRNLDQQEAWMRYEAAELFAAMFKIDSAPVVEFFEGRLDRAQAADLRLMGDLLRHSNHRFPFDQRHFIQRLLDRCNSVDRELLEEVTEEILTAATTGSWSGAPGEPMPRDVQARDDAKAILEAMSRLSPAYTLYRRILKNAEHNIARQIREGEALDGEE